MPVLSFATHRSSVVLAFPAERVSRNDQPSSAVLHRPGSGPEVESMQGPVPSAERFPRSRCVDPGPFSASRGGIDSRGRGLVTERGYHYFGGT